ncbi:AAA family ATPase [Paenibacillus sp. HJGM_3]|uniref:AAA family ATPase n=1 Tax=Paenibacillus sp. HJGM_3 TaxID=3379816 RepID=UPI00385CAF0B
MKTEVREIYIEGFGKLNAAGYELKGPMTLFYGPNEAGKSTLLAFLRAMLFGLPGRSGAAERHEPLHGGAHGGALTLTDGQGRAVRIERRFTGSAEGGRGRSGASSGSVRLLGPEDGALAVSGAAEAWLNELLGGLSADLFRSLFAFSLTELQELGTLQADELSGYLYSAGWGTSGRSVLAVERRLAQEAERLYRPRGKNQELAHAIRAWEDEEAGLRRSREQLAGYNRLADELSEVNARLAAIEEELRLAREAAAWTRRLLQAEEPFRRLERIGERLAELPERESFPVEAGSRYERAASELELRVGLLGKLEARRLELERELREDLQVDSALLEAKPLLDELLERAGVYRDQQAAVSRLRAEREQLEQQFARQLAQLGPDWDTARLVAVLVTVAAKERLRGWSAERLQLLRRREVLQAELDAADRREAAAHREQVALDARLARKREEAERRFAAWREQPAAELRYQLQQLRREHAEWARLRDAWRRLGAEPALGGGGADAPSGGRALASAPGGAERPGRSAERSRPASRRGRAPLAGAGAWRAAAWGLAALAATAPAALWAADARALAAGGLAALALAAGYAAARARREAAASGAAAQAAAAAAHERQQLERAGAELSGRLGRRLAALLAAPAAAGLREAAATAPSAPGNAHAPQHGFHPDASSTLDEEGLEQLEREADLWLTAAQELAHLEQSCEEARGTWESEKKQREAAYSRWQAAEDQLAVVDEEGDRWLEQLGLPAGLSPEGAEEVFRAIEQGTELHKRLALAVHQEANLQSSMQTFEEQATQLHDQLGHTPLQPQSDWLLSLKQLQAAADEERLLEQRRQQAEREWTALESDISVAAHDRDREASRIAELWRQAQAETLDQFLLHVKQQEERDALLIEQREHRSILTAIVGNTRLEEAGQTLQTGVSDLLEEESNRHESAAKQLEEEIKRLHDRRGRLLGEMEKLESGEEHADRLLRVQSSAAEVQRQARRWATLALASALFRTARERYETERQPEVLQLASSYFERVTGGAYTRVTAPMGEKRLYVSDRNGRTLDSSSLSRGTAEQLYLAMRLAFASAYRETAALPLIMDDVFVNFDPRRLRQVFRLMKDVSAEHQVLYFTCHPHIVEAAREEIQDLQVVDV